MSRRGQSARRDESTATPSLSPALPGSPPASVEDARSASSDVSPVGDGSAASDAVELSEASEGDDTARPPSWGKRYKVLSCLSALGLTEEGHNRTSWSPGEIVYLERDVAASVLDCIEPA